MNEIQRKIDKEIIEKLAFSDNYEAIYLIKSLKNQVANLKRKLTNLEKSSQKSNCKYNKKKQ